MNDSQKVLMQVVAVQDDSCHWYVIPKEMADEFSEESQSDEMADNGSFDEKYGKYRTGGDLNNVQLYAAL